MTEKCKSLKFLLEDLVKKGHIPKFVKKACSHKKEAEQQLQPTDLWMAGVIDMIYGVFDSASLTKNAIRHNFQKV